MVEAYMIHHMLKPGLVLQAPRESSDSRLDVIAPSSSSQLASWACIQPRQLMQNCLSGHSVRIRYCTNNGVPKQPKVRSHEDRPQQLSFAKIRQVFVVATDVVTKCGELQSDLRTCEKVHSVIAS